MAGGEIGVRGEQLAHRVQHALGEIGVQADPFPLGDAERARTIPDPAGDADPSDVVYQSGSPDRGAVDVGKPGSPRRSGGEPGDTGRMTPQEGRLQIGEIGDRGQRTVVCVGVDRADRHRLRIEDRCAWVVADVRDPACAAFEEGVDDGRVVGMTSPVSEHLAGGRPARLALPELGVAGGRDDAHRNRHLLACQSRRVPFAIPTLVRVGKCTADGFGHSEPERQTGGHLTMSGKAAPRHAGIAHRPDDPTHAAT